MLPLGTYRANGQGRLCKSADVSGPSGGRTDHEPQALLPFREWVSQGCWQPRPGVLLRSCSKLSGILIAPAARKDRWSLLPGAAAMQPTS